MLCRSVAGNGPEAACKSCGEGCNCMSQAQALLTQDGRHCPAYLPPKGWSTCPPSRQQACALSVLIPTLRMQTNSPRPLPPRRIVKNTKPHHTTPNVAHTCSLGAASSLPKSFSPERINFLARCGKGPRKGAEARSRRSVNAVMAG